MIPNILRSSLLLLGVSLLTASLSAQPYPNSLGIRVGFFNGLSYKHFFNDRASLQGILSTRWEGVWLTGLYEVHEPFQGTSQLYWFYGAGAHIGSWWNYPDNRPPWHDNRREYSIVGLDGVIGLEYFNVIGDFGLYPGALAVSVRYVFL